MSHERTRTQVEIRDSSITVKKFIYTRYEFITLALKKLINNNARQYIFFFKWKSGTCIATWYIRQNPEDQINRKPEDRIWPWDWKINNCIIRSGFGLMDLLDLPCLLINYHLVVWSYILGHLVFLYSVIRFLSNGFNSCY